MRVEVKTNKDKLLNEIGEVEKLLREAANILYGLPYKVGLEIHTSETTDSAQDTE